jgi:hypothetical protein
MMVIHVVVAFRSGHPEFGPRNPDFSAVKANGMLVAGSEGAAIHPGAAAREGEPIVVKHPRQPVRWHRPGDARRYPHQRRRAVDRSPGRSIWIIGWSSSAIAAPTQMQRCMRCCSTWSSRSRRLSSPRRSSPAGLHERTRAINPEKRRHSVIDPFARRFDPRAPRPFPIPRRSAPTSWASAPLQRARLGVAPILGGFVPLLTAAIGRRPCRHAPGFDQAKSRKHMNGVLHVFRSHGSWQSL